jgi:hypothetical protein
MRHDNRHLTISGLALVAAYTGYKAAQLIPNTPLAILVLMLTPILLTALVAKLYK